MDFEESIHTFNWTFYHIINLTFSYYEVFKDIKRLLDDYYFKLFF